MVETRQSVNWETVVRERRAARQTASTADAAPEAPVTASRAEEAPGGSWCPACETPREHKAKRGTWLRCRECGERFQAQSDGG